MDWSSRYMKAYSGCKNLYDFEYSELGRKYREAQPDKMGLVQAHLGEDISPEELLDFAVVTQVFEHVPHFGTSCPIWLVSWPTMESLSFPSLLLTGTMRFREISIAILQWQCRTCFRV